MNRRKFYIGFFLASVLSIAAAGALAGVPGTKIGDVNLFINNQTNYTVYIRCVDASGEWSTLYADSPNGSAYYDRFNSGAEGGHMDCLVNSKGIWGAIGKITGNDNEYVRIRTNNVPTNRNRADNVTVTVHKNMANVPYITMNGDVTTVYSHWMIGGFPSMDPTPIK